MITVRRPILIPGNDPESAGTLIPALLYAMWERVYHISFQLVSLESPTLLDYLGR